MKLSLLNGVGKIAILLIAPIFIMLNALPVLANGSQLFFSNACQSTTINVAVSWKDSNSDKWIDDGWREFLPGEQGLFNGLLTNNRVFDDYAESTDSSRIWSSEDEPESVVGDRSYIPKRITADFSDGSYYVNLTCSGETPIETNPEVVVERYEDIGGGWAGAKATLYRSGLLVIEGRAVSNANNSETRATVNVVGLDKNGNVLFISNHLDIPTACSRWEICPSDRRSRSDRQISPEIAKFVNRLSIHISDRQGPSIYSRITQNIDEFCNTYDNLPIEIRDAIEAKTGFTGCNPETKIVDSQSRARKNRDDR